ncbi:hypothetical protein CXB51_036985 [Gossypium anomalum]|uniref:Growth-regulating factor n=1 Tax=Gossypium anomalum TaxID=47600 RepID=A0A8J5Y068_9ROSI|nr:hypothetical protein CXB51_036985 [Gossypium anomalum]
MGRKVDPEPGRCRRTDGKKWRCSKLAYTDSKYCERHMHRGKYRSRKHVEEEEEASTGITMVNPSSTATQSLSLSLSSFETHASTEKSTLVCWVQALTGSVTNNLGLNSSSCLFLLLVFEFIYRFKQEVDHQPCGTRRSFSGSSMEDGTSWQLQSLKQNKHDQDDGDKRKPKRKIHRFIDEWPPKHRDSWLDYDDHKSSKKVRMEGESVVWSKKPEQIGLSYPLLAKPPPRGAITVARSMRRITITTVEIVENHRLRKIHSF